MQVQEAREIVVEKWQAISKRAAECPLRVDDDLTVEYDWGWSFTIVPIDPALCPTDSKRSFMHRFAIDRESGIFTPVGTKGIAEARAYLMKWRRKRAEAAENPHSKAE